MFDGKLECPDISIDHRCLFVFRTRVIHMWSCESVLHNVIPRNCTFEGQEVLGLSQFKCVFVAHIKKILFIIRMLDFWNATGSSNASKLVQTGPGFGTKPPAWNHARIFPFFSTNLIHIRKKKKEASNWDSYYNDSMPQSDIDHELLSDLSALCQDLLVTRKLALTALILYLYSWCTVLFNDQVHF